MTYKSTTKETPTMGEIIEIPNPDKEGVVEVWYSSGIRSNEPSCKAIKSRLCISRTKEINGYVNGFVVTDRWRYPGETDWRE